MGSRGCAKQLAKVVCNVSALYRDKRSPEIFGRGCAVLWAMAQEEEVRKLLRSAPLSTKLAQMHRSQLQKRQKAESERRRRTCLAGQKLSATTAAAVAGASATFVVEKGDELTMLPTWQVEAQARFCRHRSDPVFALGALIKKISASD